MVRRKKANTERSAEFTHGNKVFNLPIPNVVLSHKEAVPFIEKTSLFVPSSEMFKESTGFGPSSFSDEVLVTRNIPEVLNVVFKYGDTAKRNGEGGLEMDPTRQQIIIYTMVVCQGNLLWYQRAVPEVGKEKKFIGEKRLQGRFAVGFGGHKTQDDVSMGREELIFLRDLLPSIHKETGTMLGLNRGFFSEVEEELGLKREDIKNMKLLGAFYDKRIEDPLVPIQVGWVHTAIATMLEVDPQATSQLVFRVSEIEKAWWVPFKDVGKELVKRQSDWLSGKAPKVETWTEILIKEFWKDYLSLPKK